MKARNRRDSVLLEGAISEVGISDRWPDAVDVGTLAAFARAFTDIAVELTAA